MQGMERKIETVNNVILGSGSKELMVGKYKELLTYNTILYRVCPEMIAPHHDQLSDLEQRVATYLLK